MPSLWPVATSQRCALAAYLHRGRQRWVLAVGALLTGSLLAVAGGPVSAEAQAAGGPDLVVNQTDSPDPVGVGEALTYSISIENAGEDPASNVTLSDTLPAGATVLNVSPEPACVHALGVVVCDLGELEAGSFAFVSITVTAPALPGTLTNDPRVTASETDANPADNVSPEGTEVSADADLAVSRLPSVEPAAVGQPFQYGLFVQNNGPAAATGVTFSDVLPEGATFLASRPGSPDCAHSAATRTVTCTLGSLAAGTGSFVGIDVRAPSAPGTMTNSASVEADQADPNPSNNTSTAETIVADGADLSLVKASDRDPVDPRGQLVYLLDVANNGPTPATGVTLTDQLPNGVTFVSSTPGAPDCVHSPPTRTVTCNLGTLEREETRRVEITVSPAGEGLVTNSATVTSTSDDPDPSNNASSDETLVARSGAYISNGTVGLGVNRLGSLNYDCRRAGDPVCPERSAGGVDVVGLRHVPPNTEGTAPGCLCEGWGIADAGSGLSGWANEAKGNANVTVDGFTVDGPSRAVSTVSVSDPSVPNGRMRVVQDYHPSAASDNLFENTVTVTNTGDDGLTDMRYRRVMDWDVEPTAFEEWVTIKGSSPQLLFDSDDGFATSNPLAARSSLSSEAVCGAGYTGPCAFTDLGAGGTYPDTTSPSDQGALFDFGFGALAVGETKRFTVYYGAAPSEATALSAIEEAGAEVYSLGQSSCPVVGALQECADAPSNGGVETGVPTTFIFAFVTTTGDLSITKSAPARKLLGENLTYDLTIRNNGPDPASAVKVSDELPAGVTLVSASTTKGTCSGETTIECDLGTLSKDALERVTIVVRPSVTGSLSNTATVSSPSADAVPDNNSAIAATEIEPAADLRVTKSDSPDPVLAGRLLTYTLTATNAGPSTAAAVNLADALPAGVTFVSADAGCGEAAGTVTCALGSLADGASASRQIVVRPTAAGPLSNTATIASTTADPNGANNAATETTTVDPAADLRITKSDSPDPVTVGASLTYTLTATNGGPSSAAAVSLADTLPAGVTFVSAGTGCSEVAGRVTCTLGSLADGASVSREIVVRPTAAGPLSNTASVSSSTTDPSTGNDSATEATTVSATPAAPVLRVVKRVVNDDGGSKTAGDFSLHVKAAGSDVAGSPQAGSASGTSYTLEPGSFTVSEDAVAGYEGTFSGDCSAAGAVTLGPGETKTCTLTNDDIAPPPPPQLKVVKVVRNDDGGARVAADFRLHVRSGGADVAGSPQPGSATGTSYTLAPGAYTVAEDPVAGYPASFSGACSAAGAVTLAPGDSKTCTVTGDDVAPTLTVIKRVVNDSGGTAAASAWSMHIRAGAPPADVAGSPFPGAPSPGTTRTLRSGSYVVSESGGPSGYVASFSGDCGAAGAVTLEPGQRKTCTVTGDDIAAPPPPPPPPPPATCDGRPTTITGTSGADVINGTGRADVIVAGPGNDRIDGRGGNDLICAGTGNDRVIGGTGDDEQLGESGNDRLQGTRGEDEIRGGDGNDVVEGGAGEDRASGGTGRDELSGDGGADRLDGDGGNDRVYGNDGNDQLSGGTGADRLLGGNGNDRLFGDEQDDALFGGPGNDFMDGGSGRDSCAGGPGRDADVRCER